MSAAITIIGSGMAATTLVRELRKLNTELTIELITADDGAVYSKPMLSNALAQGKSVAKLQSQSTAEFAAAQNIEILKHRRVEQIDPVQQQIVLDGETRPYQKLVLALGASPIQAPFEGDSSIPFSINSLSDYAQVRPKLEAAERIAIIGPGLIGCEFANDLQSLNKAVHIIGPDQWPISTLLPEAAGEYLQQQLEHNGIEFHLQTTLKALHESADGLELELAKGEHLEVDLVLSAIGLRPNIGLAQAADLPTARGIVINEFTEVSEAIYALGDCVEFQGQVLPFVMPLMQQARALAQTLNGTPTAISYPPMPVMIKTPSCPVTVLPFKTDNWQIEAIDDGLRCLAYEAEKLRGFCLLGSAARERQQWIKQLG